MSALYADSSACQTGVKARGKNASKTFCFPLKLERLTSFFLASFRVKSGAHPPPEVIGVEDPATGRTRAHCDDPLRVRHLIVDPPENRGHLAAYAPGHDHQISLTRRPSKDLGPEPGEIEARGARRHHLDGTAGKAETGRPDGRFPRPIDQTVECREKKTSLELRFLCRRDLRVNLCRPL